MELTASIHTVSIIFEGMIDVVEEERIGECIQSSYFRNTGKTSCKINVNRLYGDIYKYSEFRTALDTITVNAGIKEYQISRVDVRLDSFNKEDYKKYAKLNRLMLSLLGTAYTTPSNYKSTDLFTNQQLSLSVRNDYFQVEYYDKYHQSRGKDQAKSRLELRSLKKRLDIEDLSNEFQEEWNRRWQKAEKCFDEMQMKYNQALEQVYKQDRVTFPRKYTRVNNFLTQYQECIFTKNQMLDLLSRFEDVKNPQNKEKNYRQRYGIKYYMLQDVEDTIQGIKEAVTQFFEN